MYLSYKHIRIVQMNKLSYITKIKLKNIGQLLYSTTINKTNNYLSPFKSLNTKINVLRMLEIQAQQYGQIKPVYAISTTCTLFYTIQDCVVY